MTTHELANLLEHLRDGLGSVIIKKAAEEIGEAAVALRGLPDKSLKDHVKDLAKLGEPGPNNLLDRIQASSTGDSKFIEAVVKDVKKLKKPELEALLTSLGKTFKDRTVPLMKSDIEAIIRSGGTGTAPTETPTTGSILQTDADQEAIVRGVRLFERLRDTPNLTIDDIRNEFEPFRKESRHVLLQVSSRVGFSFDGTRDEIAGRLQEVLERLKVSQIKGEIIRNAS